MLCPLMRKRLVSFITLVVVQFHHNWHSLGCSVFQTMDSLSLYNAYVTVGVKVAALQATRAFVLTTAFSCR